MKDTQIIKLKKNPFQKLKITIKKEDNQLIKNTEDLEVLKKALEEIDLTEIEEHNKLTIDGRIKKTIIALKQLKRSFL
jgi:hypothetical protein